MFLFSSSDSFLTGGGLHFLPIHFYLNRSTSVVTIQRKISWLSTTKLVGCHIPCRQQLHQSPVWSPTSQSSLMAEPLPRRIVPQGPTRHRPTDTPAQQERTESVFVYERRTRMPFEASPLSIFSGKKAEPHLFLLLNTNLLQIHQKMQIYQTTNKEVGSNRTASKPLERVTYKNQSTYATLQRDVRLHVSAEQFRSSKTSE